METFALIPSYRPDHRLVELVGQLAACGRFAGTVVVDDGSGPDYAATFEAAGAAPGVEVLRHATNVGKGAALKTGINGILAHHGPDVQIVTVDGDGQHDAEDAAKVADVLATNPAALVIGARSFGKGVPLRSRIGNLLTRRLVRIFHGLKLADTQSGLRGLPGAFAVRALAPPSQRYEYELDMLILAGATGTPIVETPIATIYTNGNRSSHFNPIVDSLLIYFSLFRFTLSALAAMAVDFIGFYAGLLLGSGIPGALVTGRVLAIPVNFMLNRKFVFHHKGRLAWALAKYLSLVVVLAVASYALLSFFIDALGVHVILAKIMAEGMLFLFSYLAQRELIFADHRV